MVKRSKLEIIKDILEIIKENNAGIRPTPLLRKSNLSSKRYNEYFKDLIEKGFVREIRGKRGERMISLTERGFKFLDKYQVIVGFIDEFEL